MILHQDKELAYHKWKEKAEEPTKVIGEKDLETHWPTVRRKPKRNHCWR